MSFPLQSRLRYRFDNFMSRGTPAMLVGLALLSLLLIFVSALVVVLAGIVPDGSGPLGFAEALWTSLMHSMDAGTVAGDSGWAFRALMFIVTLGGIFVVSTLIGALSNGIQSVLEELRKGRSLVCEQNHTVLLGYSSKLPTLVAEIAAASSNHKGTAIVVLAPRDKVELEDELAAQLPDLQGSRLIVRSGDPCALEDLAIANVQGSRSIVVLSPEDRSDTEADAWSIKTLLALVNHPERRSTPYHIVAEIRDPANVEIARIAGKGEAELIATSDFVARLMVQTSRQSGLSIVYQELLSFAGSEIYVHPEPSLAGRTFADAMQAYGTSSIIGIANREGLVKLNPPRNTLLAQGDCLVAIADDDDTIVLQNGNTTSIRQECIVPAQTLVPEPESTLILGWNAKSPNLLHEYDQYMLPGSRIVVVANHSGLADELARIAPTLKAIHLKHIAADPMQRSVLEELDVAQYDHILVLAEPSENREHADNRVLMILLQLRHIQASRGLDLDIVSEMMNMRNRDIAEAASADDFIVSDRLVALLIAQVAENKALMQVFADLFHPAGSEIYLKPADQYIQIGATVSFATLCAAASMRGEIAIGYREMSYSNDSTRSYGVVLNPPKSAEITLSTDDRIIVLAEN